MTEVSAELPVTHSLLDSPHPHYPSTLHLKLFSTEELIHSLGFLFFCLFVACFCAQCLILAGFVLLPAICAPCDGKIVFQSLVLLPHSPN